MSPLGGQHPLLRHQCPPHLRHRRHQRSPPGNVLFLQLRPQLAVPHRHHVALPNFHPYRHLPGQPPQTRVVLQRDLPLPRQPTHRPVHHSRVQVDIPQPPGYLPPHRRLARGHRPVNGNYTHRPPNCSFPKFPRIIASHPKAIASLSPEVHSPAIPAPTRLSRASHPSFLRRREPRSHRQGPICRCKTVSIASFAEITGVFRRFRPVWCVES